MNYGLTYTVHHADLGPITHTTAGFRAMRKILWAMAASGTTIIVH